jgi:predicted DCC family thiol-disulfide oxidoreductase YuxK
MTKPALLFFDGICALCNKSVRFILRHEKTTLIQFVALESDAAKLLLKNFCFPIEIDSVIFVTHDQCIVRSDVLIALARYLKFPWSFISVIRFIPKPIRDRIYDQIARIRYHIWGKYDTCPLPDDDSSKRFVSTRGQAQIIGKQLRPNQERPVQPSSP